MDNDHTPADHGQHQHGHSHGHQHAHHQHPAAEIDEAAAAAMMELLDLDAAVLRDYLADLVDWVHDLAAKHAGDQPVRRILDLGAGTGTGALALARRFTQAEVTAVDLSNQFLDRLRDKAQAEGLADRIHPLQADLDAGWPPVGAVDLVWASASLHHMADPGRVLADIHAALPPGALFALVEMDAFPRFLPEDAGVGRPGLEDRLHATRTADLADAVPHLGADWGPPLTRAGFAIEAERRITVDLAPPLPAAVRRYAQLSMQRLLIGLGSQLAEDDVAALRILVDGDAPESLLRRDDLIVHAERIVWIARRP